MIINNVTAKTSMKGIGYSGLLLAIYVFISAWIYSLDGVEGFSIREYFEWIAGSLTGMLNGTESLDGIIFYILPAIFFIILISQIVLRNRALKDISSFENLKMVDLQDSKINFNFNSSQYDFSCGYGDIEHLEVEIHTDIVRSKSSTYTVISEIKLIFTVLNGKTFFITNTAVYAPMGFIYKVLDYAKKMKSYSYNFTGIGDIRGYQDKIENYLKYGIKRLISKNTVSALKVTSILFFVLGSLFLYLFKDWGIPGDISFMIMLLFMPGMFILISLIIDLLLLADEIKLSRINKGL